MSKIDTLKNINNLLKNNVYMDNILQYYDNVTYNIRFYMLNRLYQEKITEIRNEGDTELNNFIKRLPDDSKIIIAETGVSSKYNIKRLSLKTIHPSAANSTSVATYELNLYLQEVGGSSLVNHITAVSKLVGYDCYMLQPFHIDIWFSGYETATGKPVQVIEDKVYTYEVLLSDVKTTTSNTGMEYNFTMIPTGLGNFNKSKRLMIDMGMLSATKFGELKFQLTEYINKKFLDENPKIRYKYTMSSGNDSTGNDDGAYFKFDKVYIKHLTSKNSLAFSIYDKNNNSKIKDDTALFDSLPFDDFMSNINVNDSKDLATLQAKNEETLDEILQKALLACQIEEYKNYILRVVYKVKNFDVVDGQVLSKIRADIILTENAYLKYYNERYKMEGTSNKKTAKDLKKGLIENKGLNEDYNLTNDNIDELIDKMAMDEMYSLLGENRLNKRYEWQYNGRETSLLDFQAKLDRLWYANIPYYNEKKLENEILENSIIIAKKETDSKFKDLTNSHNYEDFKKFIEYTNVRLKGVRGLASDKRLYLDDVYNCIEDDAKKEFLNGRTIVEKADFFSEVTQDETNANLNMSTLVAKTGYENIHASGGLVEITLKIIGDPYWLGVVEDNNLYNCITNGDCGKFDNIGFRLNTTLGQKEDGTYDIENMVDFSNIYQVIESTSEMENGQFIQSIRAVVNMAFLYFPRLGV